MPVIGPKARVELRDELALERARSATYHLDLNGRVLENLVGMHQVVRYTVKGSPYAHVAYRTSPQVARI